MTDNGERNDTLRLTGAVGGILLLALTGCHGNSSGGGDNDSGESPAGNDGDPAAITTLQLGAGSLLAIPPSQPSDVNNVDPDADANPSDNPPFFPITIVDGEITAGGSQGLHPAEILYARGAGDDQGKLYRVTTDTRAFSGLAPQRVSSETEADQTCIQASDLPGGDFVDLDNTPIVYATKQPAQSCDDDITLSWKLVRLGDDATQAPRDFPAPDQTGPTSAEIVTLRDAEGGFAGWLIEQTGKLVRLDANADVADGDVADITEFFEFLALFADGTVLLNIDGGLFGVDIADNSLTDYGYTFPQQPGSIVGTQPRKPFDSAFDGRTLFFLVKDGANSAQLYRTTDEAGVAKIDENTDSSDIIRPDSLVVGATHAAWVDRTTDSSDVLRSAAKDATDVSSGQALHELSSIAVQGATSDQWVFYQDGSFSGGDAFATRLDGTAGPVTFPSAQWAGYSLAADRTVGGAASPASRFYRIDSSSTVGGEALISVSAEAPADRDADIDLGIIPAELSRLTVLPGFGPERVIAGIEIGDTLDTDLLFLNDMAPGSLQKITDTADQNEFPLVLF